MFQFFSPLVNPLIFLWALCLIGTLILWKKKQRLGAAFLGFIVVFVWLVGSRISLLLVGSLEKPYIRQSLAEIPPADVVMMLGGSQEYSKNDLMGFNLTDASDRILIAVEMAKSGKAGALVLGGGGDVPGKNETTEAQALQNWIERWQLINVPILNLGRSANTHEEAVKFAALKKERGWRRVILVTSAFHMRRAVAVFPGVGVEVLPVACDFQRPGTPYVPHFDPFPAPQGFKWMDLYLHEQIGMVVYRLRGWIGKDNGEPAVLPTETKTNPPASTALPTGK